MEVDAAGEAGGEEVLAEEAGVTGGMKTYEYRELDG